MTLDYKSAGSPAASKHDHIYTSLLGVLAFSLAVGAVEFSFLRMQPTTPDDAKRAFLMVIQISGLFLGAILTVLLIRIVFPKYRRWPSFWLNLILLVSVPLGTALAIYWFWKVDKSLRKNPN